jgi:site-specific DNA recombinase
MNIRSKRVSVGIGCRRAIAYIRVSTEKQEISPASQRQAIEAYCTLHQLNLQAIVEESVSAGIPLRKRPKGQQLIEPGVGNVVTLKLDRLFRNTADALVTIQGWDKAGVALHLIEMGGMSVNTKSSMGGMFLTMMAGYAEFERKLVSERTSSALQHKIAKGERTGNVRYGWQAPLNVRDEMGRTVKAGRVEPNPIEQANIEQIRASRRAGRTLQGIADDLNNAGRFTRKGTPWNPCYVDAVVRAGTR